MRRSFDIESAMHVTQLSVVRIHEKKFGRELDNNHNNHKNRINSPTELTSVGKKDCVWSIFYKKSQA